MRETHYDAALNALQHITSGLGDYVLDARTVAFGLTGARKARATELADKLGDADDLTAANVETTAAPEGAHAYALDYPVEDYPLTEAAAAPDDPRARRTRWVLSLAVLLAAAAAFIAAGTHGMRVLTAPTAAPVTVTLPPPDRNAQFLADLARAGIPVGDPNHAVLGGYFVCVWLLSDDDERRRPLPPQVGGPLTGLQFTPQFIEVSKAHYCPNRHL